MHVLKAPHRSNIAGEANLLSFHENRTEETTPRNILTPKRHLSQVKVYIITK